jgi:ferric-dicitrate binding protein FerR (iron transport regulator)
MNAFDDEAAMKVTLLEGLVKTSMVNGEWSILKPGDQAQLSKNIKVVKGIDVDAVMAWKNGLFNFNNSDLEMVMRQLARWYDVEVMYQGSIPKRSFGGEMQRDLNLSDVLKILEKNNVRFKIEGKRLIVLP